MLLKVIWIGSFALAASSIIALLILWIRRLIIQRAETKLETRRREISEILISALDNPADELRLANIKNTKDQRILLGVSTRLLQNLEGELRNRVILFLNNVIDIDQMLAELNNGAAGNRAKVAARLFWSQNQRVHVALRRSLADPEPEVVMAAANSLLVAGQPLDIAELMPHLKANDMLHHRGVRDLVRRMAAGSWMSVIEMLEGQDDDVALVVADAVAADAHPDVLWALIRAAQSHKSRDVRAAALRALGLSLSGQAADAVLKALDDPAWEVQVQAVIAAGRLKLVGAIPRLVELLYSDSWWVQLRAAQSLVRMGPPGERELRQLPFDSPIAALADIALAERHA
jgi:HEAT repeat protein